MTGMTTSTNIHVVVGGFPELTAAFRRTGLFEYVHEIQSTSQLRDLVKGGSLPKEKARLVFVFSSTTQVDTAENLEYLVGRLSTAGWRVVILGTSPIGRDIVNAHPAAGYLESPFSINQILGALAGLGFVGLEPTPDGFDAVYPGQSASPTPWQAAEPTTTNPAPTSAPTPQPAPGGAWVRPADTPPAAPAPARPAPNPVPQRPASWDSTPTSNPTPSAEPGWGQQTAPAPTPVREPQVAQPPRSLARPSSAPTEQQRPLVRPGNPGPIGRRVGTYQDFAPTTPGTRRRGHVITIASPKGGTGKSSLSANLAVHLGLSLRGTGRRVCLIDANFQQADTGKLLNVYSPNVTNIVKDEGSLVPERIEQYMIDRRDLNTSFLLGPATPRDASPMFFNSRLYTQILDVLRQNFDYILIDTPVAELYHDILRGFALPQADYIVVPITPAIHTLMNADGWLRTITLPRHQGGDEIDVEKVGVVLNQAQEGVDCDEEQVRRELFAWRFIGSVPMTKDWLRANNNNEFVATKNLAEIGDAFANILYAATGEETLLQGLHASAPGSSRKGLMSRLRRRS